MRKRNLFQNLGISFLAGIVAASQVGSWRGDSNREM